MLLLGIVKRTSVQTVWNAAWVEAIAKEGKGLFSWMAVFCFLCQSTHLVQTWALRHGHTRRLLPVKAFHEWNSALLSRLSSWDLLFTSECFGWVWLSRIAVHEWNVKTSMALLNWLKRKPTQQTFGNRAQEVWEAAWAIWHLI